MYGLGILRGLGVTLKHFVDSVVDDFRFLGKRYYDSDAVKIRQGTKGRGAFTVQYPEEKLPVPENFRFVPFLVYEEKADGTTQDRCTSCGICSKVCPPQCIWIERTTDPVTKRPVPEPRDFHIDIDICMNCGFCAEFCPFDAIKMDHDYELASYDRTTAHIHNKERLSKPVSYYQSIRPNHYLAEEQRRAEEEAKKANKGKPAAGTAKAEEVSAAPAVATSAPVAPSAPSAPADPEAEARKKALAEKRKAELAAKKAAKGG
ncbi:MAG TPA: 4Fe-4S binding protein [Anaerolineales bacterium]|nr:4Fe-4S binding protein [Anaerolineales bacterium]